MASHADGEIDLALQPSLFVDSDSVSSPPPIVTGGDDVPLAGPFYFALVDEDETTFGPEHHRMDWFIFDARRTLTEGEKPKLVLEIENPRVGLLSPLLPKWCWFAWDNGEEIVPIFFGRIFGIPTDLQNESIHVTFISWPNNYVKQLQKIAKTLKVAPYYDPVFIDVAHRDDPLALFEGHSKLICVDPVTLQVTASDILDGEDGTEDFNEDDHFYASMKISPGAVPKTCVHVDATVSWTQTGRGYVTLPTIECTSYSGDGILSDWPKPLSNIAPGLTVFNALAWDKAGIDRIVNTSWSISWQNKEREHSDGDQLSLSVSHSGPARGIGGASGGKSITLTETYQPGIIDPFSTDGNGDPKPTNIPMSYTATSAYVYPYVVSASMMLEYNASRPHTERLIFRLFADVQPTTLDPAVSEDTELLTISGSDVGLPIIDLLNWVSVSETHVPVGTIIFPSSSQFPGNRSAQIAIDDGTAGSNQPDFSDVPGEETVDDTVTWTSLGVASPTENAHEWTKATDVPAGTVWLPRRPAFADLDAFIKPAAIKFPPASTPISEGTWLRNGSVFLYCTQSGIVGPAGTTATFATYNTLPTGTTYFLAINSGTTGTLPPEFGAHSDLHNSLTDGGVTWVAIGTGEIPVGGVPGNVTGYTYFATDRGKRSVEHLICRARARLRFASRCVNTTFLCDYARGAELTLRMNAALHDPRLPGGVLTGKVTSTELVASDGEFTCSVTLGSSVGRDTAMTEVPGDPTYVEEGYVSSGYQQYDNVVVAVQDLSEVGYSPLVSIPDEDGISFPLAADMFTVFAGVRTTGNQAGAVGAALNSMKLSSQLAFKTWDPAAVRQVILLNANSLSAELQQNPVWIEYEFKPINGNGTFSKVYHMKCTTLGLPQMINLEEESTT